MGAVIEQLHPGKARLPRGLRQGEDDHGGEVVGQDRGHVGEGQVQQMGQHTGSRAPVTEQGDGLRAGSLAEQAAALMAQALLLQEVIVNADKVIEGNCFSAEFAHHKLFQTGPLLFDPPATSFVLDAYNKQLAEMEWRINSEVETNV